MKIKKLLSITIMAVLMSGAAHSATTMFFDDFDTYLIPGDPAPLNLVDKANHTYAPTIVWALIQPVVDNPASWYRGPDWGSLMGMTNADNVVNQCPADSSAGSALKVGVWQNWGGRLAMVNTDLIYDVNTNHTVSFQAMLKVIPGQEAGSVAAEAATGTVNLAVGYMNSSNNFVSISGVSADLSATNWLESSASVNGGGLTGADTNALGQALIIRFERGFFDGNNSSNYQSFVDWVQVDVSNPWAEWVDLQDLGTYDRTADYDLDGADNFTEWAIGGDPKDGGDTGYAGYAFVMDQGGDGTNEFVYVTPRIVNHWATGIQYAYDRTEDLVAGSWERQVNWDGDGGDYMWDWQPSDSEGFGPGYDAVTNFFRMADTNGVPADPAFIRMTIGHVNYNP